MERFLIKVTQVSDCIEVCGYELGNIEKVSDMHEDIAISYNKGIYLSLDRDRRIGNCFNGVEDPCRRFIYPPNFLERLFKITYKAKVLYAVDKVKHQIEKIIENELEAKRTSENVEKTMEDLKEEVLTKETRNIKILI
jgi:hypothetical protein